MYNYREIDKYELRILVFSAFILLVSIFVNGGLLTHPDSEEYTKTLEIFAEGSDKSGLDKEVVLFRPLIFILALPFYYITGDSMISIGLLNSLFYIFSGPIFYRYVNFHTQNEVLSFWSSIYFLGSFPVLYWGLSILMEMGTWFLLLLCLYRLRKISVENIDKNDYITMLIVGFSILYKPTLVVIPIFIFISLLFKFGIKQFPIKYFCLIGLILSVPIIINQIYVLHFFEADYYNDFLKRSLFFWEKDSTPIVPAEYSFKYTQTYRLLTFFVAFPMIIPFFIIGILDLKHGNKKLYNYSLLYIFSSLIIILGFSSTLNYIGAGSPRYAFILFPVFIPITIIGIESFFEKTSTYYEKFHLDKKNLSKYLICFYLALSFFISIFGQEVRQFLGFW